MSDKDTRYVFGASCTFSGSISEVSTTDKHPRHLSDAFVKMREMFNIKDIPVLPCCPYCGGMLMQVDYEEKYWQQAREYEKTPPNYTRVLMWGIAQKKCFRTEEMLIAKYTEDPANADFPYIVAEVTSNNVQ